VNQPGTIVWFAEHEARLAWRDWLSLMTAGSRRRARTVAIGFILFACFVHGLAYLMLTSSANVANSGSTRTLVILTGTLVTAWSLMLSQALESVTRAFYARGDLELILSSPAAASRLFAVRIAAMTVTIVILALVLAGPFINVLVLLGGVHWLGGYVAIVALAMDAVAISVVLTVALFRAIGPRRTRVVAQIVAAVVGAAFAIGMQLAAIVSYGTMSRMAILRSDQLVRLAPDRDSLFWWPARAVLGEPAALVALVGLSVAALAATIYFLAPRFGHYALTAASVAPSPTRRSGGTARFRTVSPGKAMRHKEWTLLLRDPWLISQTLMQLLYLLPAVFVLWRSFSGGGMTALLVPVLIMAAGQLGGGLAWLAVSGEDAPELIATAPVPAAQVLRAKTEAVLGCVAVVFGPLVILLAVVSPVGGLVALGGVAVAAGSSTAIQYWFRTQARRSLFRRRQTSSRIATFAEALSSTLWAGTGALFAAGTWFAIVPGVVVLAIIAGAWMISPERAAGFDGPGRSPQAV
jgi:ABC-2 type transport system permease protein